MWIRIRMDPHQFGNLDPHTDPHQSADDQPKCMEYEPIWALFQGFDAFVWKLGSGSGSVSGWKVGSGSTSGSRSKWCGSTTLLSTILCYAPQCSKWDISSKSKVNAWGLLASIVPFCICRYLNIRTWFAAGEIFRERDPGVWSPGTSRHVPAPRRLSSAH